MLLRHAGISEWQTPCRCTVWGQSRKYTPLELARHHQNQRLINLLEAFQRDGSAACDSAALVTAMQRMLLCHLCEEYELCYDSSVEIADNLPPAPLPSLLRFVRQGFLWHGSKQAHAQLILSEMRMRLAADQAISPGFRVLVPSTSGGAIAGAATDMEAIVQRVDPGPPARLRLEWEGGSGWRMQREVKRVPGMQCSLGNPQVSTVLYVNLG
eukprot:SAG31_NODE_6214_length_2118_cov_1.263992_2_plen_212_part_00